MEMEPERVATAGIAALRERWGDGLVFGHPEVMSGSGRSVVLRLPVSGPDAAAASVILKGYADPSPSGTTPDPMENEAVAGTLFGELPGPAVGPELLAVDLRGRVLVLSDLGSHPALSDLLLAADPVAAEQALIGWATALGGVAARTRDPWPRVARIRQDLGLGPRADPMAGQLRSAADAIADLALQRFGIRAPVGLGEDLAAVLDLLEPSAYDIFSPADACPDNNQVTPDGVRLLDFEFAGCYSLFIDAAYTVTPFPTCWCVLDMPAPMTARAEAAYREAVVATFPELSDDGRWYDGLIRASALCALTRICSMLRRPPGELSAGAFQMKGVNFPGAVVEAHFRLGRFFALAGEAIPSLTALLRDIDQRLVTEFDAAALIMPQYPAFARPAG